MGRALRFHFISKISADLRASQYASQSEPSAPGATPVPSSSSASASSSSSSKSGFDVWKILGELLCALLSA
eukprot:m.547671 g.547671  ORF g.547671 m.547671 type:complete len:71 (-) comp57704_c0_seq6:44-256(-)